MLQADVEQRKDMGIGQRIVYGLAVPAELDQPGIAQDAQLMGHSRLAHTEFIGNIPDADFLIHEDAQYAQPCRIAEDFEDIGKGWIYCCESSGARRFNAIAPNAVYHCLS